MGKNNRTVGGNNKTTGEDVSKESLLKETEHLTAINELYKKQIKELSNLIDRMGIKQSAYHFLRAIKRSVKHRVINIIWYKGGYQNSKTLQQLSSRDIKDETTAKEAMQAIMVNDAQNITLIIRPNKVRQALYHRVSVVSRNLNRLIRGRT